MALVFFVISFFTLNNYGVSWDESIHFARGQAYLYYYTLATEDFSPVEVFFQKIIIIDKAG